jgi:dephospho-CoA kinase
VLVVGLTGGIGAGKSTVAARFAQRGATVIDVDALGRQVLEPDGGAYDAVVRRFGHAVVGDDGRIDRTALARVVFGDERALADLTTISHPAINALLADRLSELDRSGTAVVVLDMAVLVESELGRGQYDQVVVVEAPWPLRLERLAARGMRPADAQARRDAQATDAERRAVADFVIVNDGDEAELARRVDVLWDELVSLSEGGTSP